jgi:hypothetical protein
MARITTQLLIFDNGVLKEVEMTVSAVNSSTQKTAPQQPSRSTTSAQTSQSPTNAQQFQAEMAKAKAANQNPAPTSSPTSTSSTGQNQNYYNNIQNDINKWKNGTGGAATPGQSLNYYKNIQSDIVSNLKGASQAHQTDSVLQQLNSNGELNTLGQILDAHGPGGSAVGTWGLTQNDRNALFDTMAKGAPAPRASPTWPIRLRAVPTSPAS